MKRCCRQTLSLLLILLISLTPLSSWSAPIDQNVSDNQQMPCHTADHAAMADQLHASSDSSMPCKDCASSAACQDHCRSCSTCPTLGLALPPALTAQAPIHPSHFYQPVVDNNRLHQTIQLPYRPPQS